MVSFEKKQLYQKPTVGPEGVTQKSPDKWTLPNEPQCNVYDHALQNNHRAINCFQPVLNTTLNTHGHLIKA